MAFWCFFFFSLNLFCIASSCKRRACSRCVQLLGSGGMVETSVWGHQASMVAVKSASSCRCAGSVDAFKVIEWCFGAPPQSQRPPLESRSLPRTFCRGRRWTRRWGCPDWHWWRGFHNWRCLMVDVVWEVSAMRAEMEMVSKKWR